MPAAGVPAHGASPLDDVCSATRTLAGTRHAVMLGLDSARMRAAGGVASRLAYDDDALGHVFDAAKGQASYFRRIGMHERAAALDGDIEIVRALRLQLLSLTTPWYWKDGTPIDPAKVPS
jgi:hypothetical protein